MSTKPGVTIRPVGVDHLDCLGVGVYRPTVR